VTSISSFTLAAVLLLAPAVAAADPASGAAALAGGSASYINPHWAAVPAKRMYMSAYPPAALQAHTPGRAVLDCAVAADGSLADCAIVDESPGGQGFGDAALKLAPLFKLNPDSAPAGQLASSRVVFPVSFLPH
jgi:protein TonB